MNEAYQSMTHSKWDCKYHAVFIPKRRRKVMYGNVRSHLGAIFHELARQKEGRSIEGHLQPDHVHMCVEVPPKYAVASIVGFLKGKSAIAIARQFNGKERNFTGELFWAGAVPGTKTVLPPHWNCDRLADLFVHQYRSPSSLSRSGVCLKTAPQHVSHAIATSFHVRSRRKSHRTYHWARYLSHDFAVTVCA